MNEVTNPIATKILFFRGVAVLLDRDLAAWFEVKLIRLRGQVKRCLRRFPVHFRFIDEEEVQTLVSQINDSKNSGLEDKKVFDESALTKLLVNAVKELKAQNDALRARVEALENKEFLEANYPRRIASGYFAGFILT